MRAGNVKKPIGLIHVRKSCIKAQIQCESGITLTAVISSGQPTKCLSRWTKGAGLNNRSAAAQGYVPGRYSHANNPLKCNICLKREFIFFLILLRHMLYTLMK